MGLQKVPRPPDDALRTKRARVAPDETARLKQKIEATEGAKPDDARPDQELEILKAKLHGESTRPAPQRAVPHPLKLKEAGAPAVAPPARREATVTTPPPAGEDAPVARPIPLPVPHARLREECTIRWWRGYVKSQFIAATAAGEEIASSPYFRWRGHEPPPEGPPATDALRDLVAQLHDAGWRETDRGKDWFELSFTCAPPSRRQRRSVYDTAS